MKSSVPFWSNRVRVPMLCMLAHWKHSATLVGLKVWSRDPRGSLRGFQMAPCGCECCVKNVKIVKRPTDVCSKDMLVKWFSALKQMFELGFWQLVPNLIRKSSTICRSWARFYRCVVSTLQALLLFPWKFPANASFPQVSFPVLPF